MKRYSFLLLLVSAAFFPFASFSQEPKLMLPIGHSSGVITAEFSPDGKRIVTSSFDTKVKIWEVSTGKLLADLLGHTDTVYTARYSPDGRLIVSAGEDSVVKIWDALSAVQLLNLKGHTDKIYTAEFSSDGKKIVTTSADKTVKIWETSSGELLANLKEHTAATWLGHFSLDGNKIISASEDSTAKIWDTRTGKLLIDLRLPATDVWSAEFSPDGKKVITGWGDSATRIWDVVTGKILLNLTGFKKPVRFTSFSLDGKKILSATEDGNVKLFDAEIGTSLTELPAKKKEKWNNPLRVVNLSPDGKKILTGYLFDTSAKIWDANTGKLLLDIKRGAEYINSASFSPDGKKFALALAYGHAEIWDVDNGTMQADLKGRANYIKSFYCTPDSKKILVTNQFGSAKILDAETGSQIANFPVDENSKEGVFASFSPDGKKIIAVAHDNTARLYDVLTGTLLHDLRGHSKPVNWAFFSPDGKKIYTSSLDSTWKIWDASTGKMLFSFTTRYSPPYIRLSLDGKIAFTNSFDSTCNIWNTENGQLITAINNSIILNPSLSSDGKKILAASLDSTAKVWDATSGNLLLELKEPNSRIRSVSFNPDGKKIIFISENRATKIVTAKMLDAVTGKIIADLKPPGSSFRYNVLFSPDGKEFYAPMNEGCITIWNAESGDYIKTLKGLTGPLYFFTEQSFSPDRKKLVMGDGVGIVKVWDIETGNTLLTIIEQTLKHSSAMFSPDGKKIITVSGHEKTAKVWDAETGNFLYTFISVNKDDYLVLDKYNHFDGTEGGRKSLFFTCGTEVIELDQVKDQLWVPNLVERILNGETINAQKLFDLNICNLTPIVDTIEQTALQYRFRITPRLGGLSTTIVSVNGIEVKRYTSLQLVKQKETYQLAINKSELQKFFVAGKENSITVKSLTAKNSISSRSVSINEKGNEKSAALPNLYAVVVGVSDYKGEELDLSFAAKDAVDIANALDASAKKLLNTDDKEHVFIYKLHTSAGRDKFPEKNSIKQVFTEIAAKAQPNDILLIFFAGHGVMESLSAGQAGEKNQFYFLTADASNATVSGALKDVGISTDELTEWIKPQTMKAQKRILIFDACNSGQAIKEIISMGKGGQNFLAARGDEKSKQVKAIEKLNERSGMFILSASASDQKAYEMGKYNQGALTYSLLKAIKEEPDILEDRKYLNISRWFNAAEKSVTELSRETGARQQPQIVSTTNFNIGVVDEQVRNTIVLPFEKPMFTRSDFRNIDLRTDNLKLRTLVDKELGEISENNISSTIMYSPEYDGANVYAISGDYTVKGNEVIVSVILTKGGTDIKTTFEIKGPLNELAIISKSIVAAAMDWLKKK